MLLTLTLALCAAVYGATVGALVPRAVYRLAVARGQPRPDRCPAGHPLPGSWRGWAGPARCARCEDGEDGEGGARPPTHAHAPTHTRAASDAASYGPHTLTLVLAGAAVCAALAATLGPRPELAVWLLITPFGLLLAAVDIRVRRLPDVLTLPLAAATAALLGLASNLPGADGSWVRAMLGGVALAGAFFLLFLVHPRGFGFGDVKLALTPGVALGWYGWQPVLAGAFLGFLLFAAYGGVLILAGRAGRKTALPFGPFLLLGAVLGVLPAGADA
ncbi:MAG TPA: A24 family peptidase [Streptomyces sp.]|nr:A24 family peptidase [Streptomyces sp.]